MKELFFGRFRQMLTSLIAGVEFARHQQRQPGKINLYYLVRDYSYFVAPVVA